jgi:hypothetical protein
MLRKTSAAAAVFTFVTAGSVVLGGAALADVGNTDGPGDTDGDACSIQTAFDSRNASDGYHVHQTATATGDSCSLVSSVAPATTDGGDRDSDQASDAEE